MSHCLGKLRAFAALSVLGAVLCVTAPPLLAGASATAAPALEYRLAQWPQRGRTPDFSLLDVEGRTRTLADYRGRIVILFFGFVRCPDACPAELFKLSLVMKKLGALGARTQVLFVTLDPQRDTPQILKKYVFAFDPRFVALSGSPAQVDRAASSFFVRYARVGSGSDYTIDHSAESFVIDAQGRLRLVGTLDTSVDDFVHDLSLLAHQ